MLKFIKQLAGASPEASAVTIGGVPLTRKQEVVHTLLSGSTGTGKTTAIEEMLTAIMASGDRCIILDPNGHYVSRFYAEGDVILNPFDKRSPGWSPFNEVRKSYDFDKIARSIVPNGHGPDAAWHFYAQVLIAEVMRALIAQGEGNTAALIQALTVLPADDLKGMVAGTPAVGLFDKDSAKALASTRFVVSSYLKPYQYLSAGDFSLRAWLESGKGNLYITWREDMTTTLAPLMAAWADVLCTATLSLPADPNRRLWLLMDELASVGKISTLQDALTKGRKHGLCCVAGIQSTAQLDRLYGREAAIELRSCFRNLCAFAIAKIDVETTEVISRALGEREVDRTTKTEGRSSSGTSQTAQADHGNSSGNGSGGNGHGSQGHGNSGNNGNGGGNADSGDASVDTSNLPGNSEKGLENALASGRGHKYGIYKHLAKEGDTVSNGEIVSNSGTGSSTPAGFTTGANGQSSFLYYYHPDHLGSTGFVTDANGKLYEHLEYFPFGETWVDEHSNTLRTPYLFTGKEYDQETGLYYFGARYYDPRTSVWQSPDPILDTYLDGQRMGGVFNPFNLNMYGYVGQEPLGYTDPDGESLLEIGFLVMDVHDLVKAIKSGKGVGMASLNVVVDVVGVVSPVPGVSEAAHLIEGANDVRKGVEAAHDLNEARDAGKAMHEAHDAQDAAKEGHAPGCDSFAPGTLVMTKQGLKPIESIRGGDYVLARDEKTGKESWKRVLGTFHQMHDDALTLTFADAKNGQTVESIITTAKHPFYVKDKGWTPAGQLKVGDVVYTATGLVRIKGSEHLARKQIAYNMEVKDFHTYFVGKTEVWVHNTSCDVHHLATNKNYKSAHSGGPWSPRFEKIFKKAGMSLEDALNKVEVIGHKGPHPKEYHEFVFNRLTKAVRGLRGGAYKQALQRELKKLAKEAQTPGSKINKLLTKSL